MKTIYNFIFILLGFVMVTSCDISDNEVAPSDSFLKIYDNNIFEASYIPIDVQQTSDGGYLILSARRIENSDFTGIQLIKVDNEGQAVIENSLPEEFIHPVNNLMKIEDKFYFVAMSDISLRANLIEVSEDSLAISSSPIGGLSYPLYAAENGSDLLLLSYDNNNKNSVLSVVGTAANVKQTEAFSIGAGSDVEAPIIEHFTRTGKQLPFFAGKADGLFYFNGFFNYTLSMVFTRLNDQGADGVIQGQQDNGGISAAQFLGNSTFNLSRFNFGDNYIMPVTTVDMLNTTSSVDIEGNPFPELVADAPVLIEDVMLNGLEYSIYASNTKSKQIILMVFNKTSNDLLGTKYIGSTDPYEVAGLTQTEDGGLAIVGAVSVAGRFQRIVLVKLSKEELAEII